MRKHTLVIEGSQLGALLALAVAGKLGLGADSRQYATRRDGRAQVWAYAPEEDRGARGRWVSACREVGITVAPAPWEQAKAGA